MTDTFMLNVLNTDLPDAAVERDAAVKAQAIANKLTIPNTTGDSSDLILRAVTGKFNDTNVGNSAKNAIIQSISDAPKFAEMRGTLASQKAQIAREQVDMANKAGDAAGSAAALVAAGNYEAQNATIHASKIAGADFRDPDSLGVKALNRQREAADRLLDVNQQIVDISKKNFFDNPLDYFISNMKVPGLVKDRQQIAMVVNDASAVVSKITNSTSEAAKTINTTSRTLDADSAKRATILAAYNYNNASKQYEIIGMGHQGDLINAMQNRQKEEVAGLVQLYSLETGEEQRELLKQQRQLATQQLVDSRLAKQDAAANLAATLQDASLGRKILGGGDTQLTKSDIEFRMRTPQGKAEVDSWLDAGLQVRSTGVVAAGSNPGEAVAAIRLGGSQAFENSSFKVVRDAYEGVLQNMPAQVREEARKNPAAGTAWMNTTLLGVKKEGLPLDVHNFGVNSRAAEWYNNPETSPNGITKAPPVSAIASVSKELVNTPFFTKVLAGELAANPQLDLSFDQMLDKGIAHYKANNLALADMVAGINMYYKQAVTYNAGILRYGGLPPQKSYPVESKMPGVLFGESTGKVDALRPEAIQQAITAKIVKRWTENSTAPTSDGMMQ